MFLLQEQSGFPITILVVMGGGGGALLPPLGWASCVGEQVATSGGAVYIRSCQHTEKKI